MRIASVGHAVFATTMIGLGILGLIKDSFFTVVWQPVPTNVPGHDALLMLSSIVSVATGIGLLWSRRAGVAARILLAYLLLWLLAFRVPALFHGLTVDVYWAASKTTVMVAAAWVLYVWFSADADRQRVGFVTGDRGLPLARALYGLAIIPFGWAHFAYLENTVSLVPRWLPAHAAWAYFTGGAFIAAGLAILVGVYARLAAALSTLQMGLFLLLVWVPAVASGPLTTFQKGETVVTWALTAAAWVVTDSYRARR